MKRFRFRLERVLKLKLQKERQAELRQRQARVVLQAAQSEVAAIEDRLAQNAAALESQIGQSVEPDLWLARYQHLTAIGQALESAEAKAQPAARDLEQADAARARIATETEALAQLRERCWEEHRANARRAEQQYLDELGLHRWRTARVGGG
jgi:flagellar export protein FliJ